MNTVHLKSIALFHFKTFRFWSFFYLYIPVICNVKGCWGQWKFSFLFAGTEWKIQFQVWLVTVALPTFIHSTAHLIPASCLSLTSPCLLSVLAPGRGVGTQWSLRNPSHSRILLNVLLFISRTGRKCHAIGISLLWRTPTTPWQIVWIFPLRKEQIYSLL